MKLPRLLLTSVLCLLTSGAFAQKATDLGMSKFGVRHVRIPLTAAQINGMYAAPVKILDPQGAGKSIIVVKALLNLTGTATQFANGGAAIIQYGSTTHGGGTQACDSTIAASVFTSATALVVCTRNGAVISGLAYTSIQNAPLYISNATAAFDTGTGPATLDVWYLVI